MTVVRTPLLTKTRGVADILWSVGATRNLHTKFIFSKHRSREGYAKGAQRVTRTRSALRCEGYAKGNAKRFEVIDYVSLACFSCCLQMWGSGEFSRSVQMRPVRYAKQKEGLREGVFAI